jgi:hypothetical protein
MLASGRDEAYRSEGAGGARTPEADRQEAGEREEAHPCQAAEIVAAVTKLEGDESGSCGVLKCRFGTINVVRWQST